MNYSLIFKKLKDIFKPYEVYLNIKTDDGATYYLEYKPRDAQSKPEMFAAVMIKKNYVSVYYMPIYHNPELIKDVDAELRKHMQGKSCFNFSDENDSLYSELERLIERTAQVSIDS